MIARIFTLSEFCCWYRLDRRTARRMLRTGQLAGIQTPGGWRIPDPGLPLLERFRQQQMALADIPYIRGVEVAELLGVSTRRVRRMAEVGLMPCRVKNGRRVYSLADIVAVANRRKQGRKRQPGSYVRPWVLDWARKKMVDVANIAR